MSIYTNLTISVTLSTSSIISLPVTIQSLHSQLSTLSPMELSNLIVGMRKSTCLLDPIPSNLVKDCFPDISSLITSTPPSALVQSLKPSNWQIYPILKKTGLNLNCMSNFCPSSNLAYHHKYWKVSLKPTSSPMICLNHLSLGFVMTLVILASSSSSILPQLLVFASMAHHP